MRGGWRGLAGIAMLASATGAHGAAAQSPDQAAPAQGEAASNVTSYEPAFFARFRPNTALDMVGRIPGFSFDGGSDGRGFSGTAGNVLIDGERPPSRGDNLGSIISRIPASGVERIDVIRGGTDGIDMQGQPIVANIIRKPDAGVTGAYSAGVNFNEAGDFSPNASVQLRNQSGDQLMEGSLSVFRNEGSGEGAATRVTPAGVVIQQRASTSSNTGERVEATGVWETTWLGGKLRLNGLAEAGQFEFQGEDRLIIPGGSQFNTSTSQTLSGEAGLRYTRDLASGYSIELVGFQSLWFGEQDGVFNTPDFTSGNQSEDESGESIARATLRSPAMGDWTFEGGGEAVYNFSASQGRRSFNGAPFELDGDENNIDELRADAFATATWAPSPKLNLEMGARYEWSRISADVGDTSSQKDLMYFKPRANLSWAPAEGHQVGVSVERTVDQLDFGSFASSASFEQQVFGVGNANIEPKKNWIFNARYERQFGGQTSLVIDYTHAEIEDVLGRAVIVIPPMGATPETELEITRNTGRARRDELEIEGSAELDAIGFDGGIFTFGVELQDSTVTDPVTLEERRIANDQPWSWRTSLQQTLANGDFRWNLFLEDGADSEGFSPRFLNGRSNGTFLGANITWKPAAGWTFNAGANNLIAEDFESYSIFYSARRSVGVPVYRQDNINKARRNFFVSVRRNF